MYLRSGNNYNVETDEQYEVRLRQEFTVWKNQIATVIFHEQHLNLEDIPDEPYWDCFVEGVSVQQMYNHILRGFP